MEGDLKEKRTTFDQASQVVLDETKKNGVASLAAVTDARQKLVDYGKPALQYVRAHETPRLADTYHLFLLSLYESLAQAANPPVPVPPLPRRETRARKRAAGPCWAWVSRLCPLVLKVQRLA